MDCQASQKLDQAQRFWLGLLIISAVIAPLIACSFFRWGGGVVHARGASASVSVREMLGVKAWMVMSAVLVPSLIGLVGTLIQRRLAWWGTEIVVVVLSLVGVLGAEALVRDHRVESGLWVAVLARLSSSDWAMREPAQLRYENLHLPDQAVASTGVSVFGTSQGAVNLDRTELGRALGCPVFRRALNGMFALEMCAARPLLIKPKVQTAVFYLSPLDIAGDDSVRADWMRSMISPRSWLDVVHVLGPSLAWRNRGALAELAVAACLKLWSFRDGVRWVLFNMAGRSPQHTPRSEVGQKEAAAVRPFTADPAYVDAGFRGYGLVMDTLTGMGIDVVVFQGEVSPSLQQRIPDAYWLSTEARIEEFLRERDVCHISLEEFDPGIGPDDWADNTHMNETGRRKLTDSVVAKLMERRKGAMATP